MQNPIKRGDILKCSVCGNVVEVTHESQGEIVCCNKPMDKLESNIPAPDNPHFAHIENLSEDEKKIYFKHIATEEHHIEYIELISLDEKFIKRKYLESTESPEITIKNDEQNFYVRLYCNRDNVWATKERLGEE